MDTQNTPIHIKLWHRDFWFLAIANLLMTASVYALLPILPLYLLNHGYGRDMIAICFLAYVSGVYLTGSLVSGLVERYRRNHVYFFAMIVMAIVFALYYFLHPHEIWLVVLTSLLVGSSFGISKMVLGSTLVLDVTESFLRTEANHGSAWFGRLALSLGPLAGFWLYDRCGFHSLILFSIIMVLMAVLLVACVRFPFKAPEENRHVFSLDRFFLIRGIPLFFNLLMMTFVVGLIISTRHSLYFYCGMMGGFMLAILAEKFVFANADLKSETVTGSICIMVALLLMAFRREHSADIVSAVLCGLGIGLIGSRFLLFFIKLTHHCERGTSQSSYFLGWETGLALGLGCGYFIGSVKTVQYLALGLMLLSLLFYNYIIHPWYLNNKNR